MVQIVPFRGVLYNQDKVGDLNLVTAPPYDEISPAQQEALYQKSPYNIVRLILGKEEGQDKYQQAAAYLQKWLAEEVLVTAPRPAIYVYQQRYRFCGQDKTQRGIIARARLEDFGSGKILPHENTLSAPKADRQQLIQACKANFSQIFSFYSDREGIIDRLLEQVVAGPLLIELQDEQGIEHCLWEITDPDIVKTICRQMENCAIFIADGHHRYETALAYRDRRRQNEPNWQGEEAYNYIMMMLFNMDVADLTILPIHRMIRYLKHFDLARLKEKLNRYFNITEMPFGPGEGSVALDNLLAAMHNHEREHCFGLYAGGNQFHLLTLKDKGILQQVGDRSKSGHYRQLDVTILHDLLIERILKAEEQEWSEEHITFTIDAGQATQLVAQGQYQLALFLNPTRLAQVKEIAHAGEKMPQKSTCFYPKLLSGLVINCFED